jgi:hypothetical protein
MILKIFPLFLVSCATVQIKDPTLGRVAKPLEMVSVPVLKVKTLNCSISANSVNCFSLINK